MQYPTEESRRHYCAKCFIGRVSDDMAGFLEFYMERRACLQERIFALVNSV